MKSHSPKRFHLLYEFDDVELIHHMLHLILYGFETYCPTDLRKAEDFLSLFVIPFLKAEVTVSLQSRELQKNLLYSPKKDRNLGVNGESNHSAAFGYISKMQAKEIGENLEVLETNVTVYDQFNRKKFLGAFESVKKGKPGIEPEETHLLEKSDGKVCNKKEKKRVRMQEEKQEEILNQMKAKGDKIDFNETVVERNENNEEILVQINNQPTNEGLRGQEIQVEEEEGEIEREPARWKWVENQEGMTQDEENKEEIGATEKIGGLLKEKKVIEEEELEKGHNSEEYEPGIFIGNSNFYIFFRLFHIFYDRLSRVKEVAARSSDKLKVRSYNPSEETPTGSVGEREGYVVRDKMKYFLSLFYSVGNILDQSKYEDMCRDIFGLQAYVLYTLVKLIQQIVKQIQNIFMNHQAFQMFQHYIQKGSASQAEYANKAIALASGERFFRFFFEVVCFSFILA